MILMESMLNTSEDSDDQPDYVKVMNPKNLKRSKATTKLVKKKVVKKKVVKKAPVKKIPPAYKKKPAVATAKPKMNRYKKEYLKAQAKELKDAKPKPTPVKENQFLKEAKKEAKKETKASAPPPPPKPPPLPPVKKQDNKVIKQKLPPKKKQDSKVIKEKPKPKPVVKKKSVVVKKEPAKPVVKKKKPVVAKRTGAGRPSAKYVSNSKMKCFMRRANNGAVYRTCVAPKTPATTPPRKQLRGNPKLEGDRSVPYRTKDGRAPKTIPRKKKPKK